MPSKQYHRRIRENKRVVTHDDDGWSHVTTKGRASGTTRVAQPIHEPALQPKPAEVSEKRLKELYDQHLSRWKASASRRHVLCLLQDERFAAQRDSVQRSLCVGLGSLSSRLSLESSSMSQLVAWLDICCEVFQHQDTLILSAQDPVFNTTDVNFLASLGVKSATGNQGLTEADEMTFLFAPHLAWTIWAPELRVRSLPFIVANHLEDGPYIHDFVKDVKTSYSRIAFPIEEGRYDFWAICIYIAPSAPRNIGEAYELP